MHRELCISGQNRRTGGYPAVWQFVRGAAALPTLDEDSTAKDRAQRLTFCLPKRERQRDHTISSHAILAISCVL